MLAGGETLVKTKKKTVSKSSHSSKAANTNKAQSSKKQSKVSSEPAISIPRFHHSVRYICRECFIFHGAQIVGPAARNPRICSGSNSHEWESSKMATVYSKERGGWSEVRPRHPKLGSEIEPNLCPLIETCPRSNCILPHTEEEKELWIYMAKYNSTLPRHNWYLKPGIGFRV